MSNFDKPIPSRRGFLVGTEHEETKAGNSHCVRKHFQLDIWPHSFYIVDNGTTSLNKLSTVLRKVRLSSQFNTLHGHLKPGKKTFIAYLDIVRA